MVSAPPAGMASRAFSARFSIAFSDWFASQAVLHPSCRRNASLMAGPMPLAIRPAMPCSRASGATTVGCKAWRRPNASIRCVSVAALSAAFLALPM